MESAMSFEIVEKDLQGRIGKLRTKSGVVTTPTLLPVINPALQPDGLKELLQEVQCEAIIANAYLLKKHFSEQVIQQGIHDFLGYNGVVMTDSGAYQILVYGDVEISPEEIVEFEESIQTDIAVILDIPTGWNVTKTRATYTVNETLKRAQSTLAQIKDKEILWVGPIQGGNHMDLVAHSAQQISRLPFDIYALGSPTQVMERYLFDILTDMIITAKSNTPKEKPLHLFGAGHPFMFSLAVALGCDTFDSAAYALFARKDKYLTAYGTTQLKDLTYFPCSCPGCQKHDPNDVKELPQSAREQILLRHNLFTCFLEIKRIKQAIHEGRLWELLELRSRSHPTLFTAFKHLTHHRHFLEEANPSKKQRGIFLFDDYGLSRPAITRFHRKLEQWKPSTQYRVLVFLPNPSSKPFHRSREVRRLQRYIKLRIDDRSDLHFCLFGYPFGVIPLELDEVYPLSQYEASDSTTFETVDYVLKHVWKYMLEGNHGCKHVVIHLPSEYSKRIHRYLDDRVNDQVNVCLNPVNDKIWSRTALERLVTKILSVLNDINTS
jgi:7-cyano-7-deazaguanine tRNA-ribosyltransferase